MKKDSFQVVESCQFEDVLSIWQEKLWPGRKSPIEANSAMKWLGGIDMELMKTRASFWRVQFVDGSNAATVAVLSGHFGGVIDETRAYRTRGLWVSPEHRRQGHAEKLMVAACEQARAESCELLWTFPRKDSMPFYESMGFKLVGSWIGENDPGAGEFGPNGYALRARAGL